MTIRNILKNIKNGKDWTSKEYDLVKSNGLYYLKDKKKEIFFEVKSLNKETYKRQKIDQAEFLKLLSYNEKLNNSNLTLAFIQKERKSFLKLIELYEKYISGFSLYMDVASVKTLKNKLKLLEAKENELRK